MKFRSSRFVESVGKNNNPRLIKSQVIKNADALRVNLTAPYALYEGFYTLSIDKTVVDSGDVFTITLETERVGVGTTIPYTISGVEVGFIDELNSEDDLKGEFTVNYSGTTSISFTVSNNITLTQLTQFVLSLDNSKANISTSFLSYELTVDKTTVNEGDVVKFILNTYGLEDGTQIPYTISGSNITPDDLNLISLAGSFYIVGGSSSVQFFINEDVKTEGTETFTLSLDNGKGSESVDIIDTSREPSYTLSGPSQVNEGDTITINLTTYQVSEGSIINYTIDGIAASDIAESLTGSFTIGSGGTAQAQFNVIEDALTEGSETFRLVLDTPSNEFIDVNIVDTSRTASYSLTVNNPTVNETNNNEFTVTLITQNVNTGTVIDYTMSGSDITVDDFVGLTSLTGRFVVGTTDSITFTLDSDFKSENLETIVFSLDNNSDSLSINVEDTSVPTYTLTGPSQVNEGDVITINLSTQGVSQGDLIYYTIEGISASDIVESLTGSFTIGSGGTAQAQFNVIEDEISDGNDTFRLVLDTPSNEFIDVTIIDTSKTPGFNLTSTVDSVDETLPNNVVVITLETENVAQGTQFGYTISGTGITLDDFIGLTSFEGTFTVGVDGKDSVTLTIAEDYITENSETITLSLHNNQASKNIIINDTSVETYEIEVENGITTVNEGDSFKVILTTRGVVDNTQVPYSITGVSSNDIGGVNTEGDFTVVNNTAEIIFNITEDFSSIDSAVRENLETFNLTLTNTGETVEVNINDTSVQTFVLTTDKGSVNEGDSVTITLSTQGVDNGVTVPYAILGTGILPSDLGISNLNGSFTINNNTASVTFNIDEDVSTEGSESFTLSLGNGEDSINVTISDTSKAPTYTLERSASLVNEGESFTITLTTQNPINGTVIPYTISGIQTEDIDNTSLTGSFTVGSVESISFLVTEDDLTEGNEVFTISLNGLGVSQNVTINDTSVETYVLTTDKENVDEGGSVIITLTTQGVADGVTVPYTISGTGITTSDFVGIASLNGSFTINNNTSSVTFNISQYFIDEGNELFKLILDNGKAQTNDITIGNSQMTAHLVGHITDPGPIGDDIGGDIVSLNSTGDIIAIGDERGGGRGVVRIYQNINNDNWVLLGDPIIGETNNGFAGKVASLNDSGDRIAIGAPIYQGVGKTIIYQYIDGAWLKLGDDILLENDGYHHMAVYLSGDGKRVATGAPESLIGGINDSGVTRIHEYIDNNWVQVGNDIYGGSYDQSGACVSMNTQGNRIAIGSIDKGSRVYEYDDSIGDWVQLGSNPWGNRDSIKINASGNRIVTTHSAGPATLAYVYEYDTGSADWVQLGPNINAKMGYYSYASTRHGGIDINAVGNRVAFGENLSRIFEYIDGDWIQIVPDIIFPGSKTYTNTTALNSNGDIIALGISSALTRVSQDASAVDYPLVEIYKITSEPFILLADDSTVTAGTSITVTLNTDQNIVDGTLVPYTISGAVITPSDLGLSDLIGNFTVNSNTASITLNIAAGAPTGDILITLDDTSVDRVITIT